MALYSIKQETLTDIANAIRSKVGDTRPIYAEYAINKSKGSTGFDYTIGGFTSPYTSTITSDGASYLKIKMAYTTGKSNSYSFYVNNIKYSTESYTPSTPELVEFTVSGDSVTFRVEVVSSSIAQVGWYAEIRGYDENDNTVMVATEGTEPNNLTSVQMAKAIDFLDYIPKEAFVISGNCKYKFAGNGWNWFLDTYQDRISTENITSLEQMFDNNSNIESINFDFNCRTNTVCSVSSMFNNCLNLKAINGKIKNLKVSNMNDMFNNCQNLRYLPEFIDIDFTNIINNSSGDCTNAFYDCYSLRSISENFLKQIYQPKCTGYYYAFLYNTFYECYSLDEVKGLNPQTGKMTSNMFNRIFEYCTRVKNIIFALQEDGTPYTTSWKSQVINLAGYVGYTSYKPHILNFNSGITADKEVKDDASYQLLKNDPDWFATKREYSRYNHDSAVATINSLPDTSAYLATAGGTNTIKFEGQAGASTDGGAINTLTEEEIAVAAAKGWTVTLV